MAFEKTLMKIDGVEITSLKSGDVAEIPADVFFDGYEANIVFNSDDDITFIIENIGDGYVSVNLDGYVEIGEASSTTQNHLDIFNGDGKPAYIELYADDGTPHFLFVGSDGKLRVNNTQAPEDDTGSVIIGDQVS